MKKIKNHILKFINQPEDGILSSQTLYEVLFYLLNVYENKPSQENKQSAKIVAKLICNYQLADGGFDIGYDFIFGKNLNKKHEKEGTSPELLSLTALALFYQKVEKNEEVKIAIDKALNWIYKRVITTTEGYAIPYAPDSYDKIHITNATSFTLSALAACYPIVDEEEKKKIKLLVNGMYKFMFEQLEFSDKDKGYWPYFYRKTTTEELLLTNEKIDNYHIAQQLYHHILAQEFIPDTTNSKTIEFVTNYLVNLVDDEGFVPYTINGDKVTDKIDVWGYSSLIAAFALHYGKYNSYESKEKALRCKSYLMKYCWNGEYFSPIILNSSKEVFDRHFYPRSDAWVIHSLSELIGIGESSVQIENACQDTYIKIHDQDYMGLENHTINFRKKMFAKMVYGIKAIMNTFGKVNK